MHINQYNLKVSKLKKLHAFDKNTVMDIIYFIYPPVATKVKSTRMSTWLNPMVDGEDAMKLKGEFFFRKYNYQNQNF